MSVIPEPGKWRQEDNQEFKATLNYMMSSGPVLGERIHETKIPATRVVWMWTVPTSSHVCTLLPRWQLMLREVELGTSSGRVKAGRVWLSAYWLTKRWVSHLMLPQPGKLNWILLPLPFRYCLNEEKTYTTVPQCFPKGVLASNLTTLENKDNNYTVGINHDDHW